MKKDGIAFALVVFVALFAAATCRTTRTIVAKMATPTPTPANSEVPGPAPVVKRPTVTATPLPVVTAPGGSIYDRAPGVLYEQTMPPTLPPTPRPGAGQTVAPPRESPARLTPTPPKPAERPAATRTPTATSPPTFAPTTAAPASRPTWTPVPPTVTPSPISKPVARPTKNVTTSPTQKPGAYYEPEDWRLAVTWTPTPEKRR